MSGDFSEQQAGFRKGHLTTTCLVEFLDHIYANMDKSKLSGVLFLDLGKVFDMVDHNILLCKLKEIGLGPNYIDWAENYLLNRSQLIEVAHTLSTPAPITWGVPQGSILGPLLCIIYINSIPDAMPQGISTCYMLMTWLFLPVAHVLMKLNLT